MASEKTGARVTVGVTLFVALAVLLASQSADATTIVILKTQSEIIAAADSMVKSIGQENPAVATFCKIMPVHDFFIAAAGIYQFGSGRLNIQRVVASATQKSEPLSQAVEHSIRRIPTALFNAVSDAREKQALYDELMRGNVLTFFFGFESGKPSVYTSRLRIMDDQPARAGKPNFQS